ncbi:MAG: hypothetical protein L6R38_007712 [Xanthoria sp. 2 TBL-2021]|nr:MAG: hypothetical protein L6R38_007712 [Xanthoria sp. 2 TBL-2021]
MVDVGPANAYHFPSRKPVPAPHPGTNGNRIHQLNRFLPDVDHSRTSPSTSSPYLPYPRTSTQSTGSPYNKNTNSNAAPLSRRTPSTSTTSTSNTSHGPSRASSTISNPLSRTSSARSGQSITSSSYVALMRKQKATVWCDRAQHEDPRILAQQKAAKLRAAREVSGGGGNTIGRTSTSGSLGSGSLGVRSKIRHHGMQKAAGYSYGNMLGGGGVPLRLSATEVGDEGSPRLATDNGRELQQRVNSGRSSMGSNQWLNTGSQQGHRYSEGSTPTSGAGGSINGEANIPELEETPVPRDHPNSHGYFGLESAAAARKSTSSSETEFGDVGQLQAPPAAGGAKKEEGKSAEELRRRGSVDERANTMTGVRLFVANPD